MKKYKIVPFLCLLVFFAGCGPVDPAGDGGANAGTAGIEDGSMALYPNATDTIPDEDMAEFSSYVNANLHLMGTMMFNSCLFDVTGDGYDDICSSFFTGSGIVTTLIIVYDLQEKQGYMLNDRGRYDYMIEGVEDGRLLVNRTSYQSEGKGLIGTIVFEDGSLYFDDGTDVKGILYKTLALFGSCAEFLPDGNTSSGNYLSTADFDLVRRFLFNIDKNKIELVHGISSSEEVYTSLERISYDDWEYAVREIYMEEDPGRLLQRLDDSYTGECAVYYDADDDCIYMERTYKYFDDLYFDVTDVSKSGSDYVITYDVFSEYSGDRDGKVRTVSVTIEEADNRYGYGLVGVETK